MNGKLTSRIFCSLSSLVYLDLSRNSFDGELPIISLIPSWARESPSTDQLPEYGDALSNHSDKGKQCALSYLNLSRNQLTGSIPTGIGELTALDTLDLSYNKLEGGIPPEIGRCISLRVLSLSGCHLSGKLCASDPKDEQMRGNGGNRAGLGGLTKLESLRLDGNIFEGPLPSGFGKLSRLEILQLQVRFFLMFSERLWCRTKSLMINAWIVAGRNMRQKHLALPLRQLPLHVAYQRKPLSTVAYPALLQTPHMKYRVASLARSYAPSRSPTLSQTPTTPIWLYLFYAAVQG